MGAVWLARDEVLGRSVALKRIGFGPQGSTPDLDRAEREARLAARLNHPHVVAVYDLVPDGDDRWLVMEYVEGETLASLVRRGGALTPDRAATVLEQAADALTAAHGAGIVHRDVKPSNILVGTDGQAKLSDFGIARAQADASLTQTGLVTGSPAYLAPEVASGQQATAASDVWSLGATLYHALAGHPPYDVGDNVLGALYRIVHEETPRLGTAAGWLAPVLDATMTREPEHRWSMAQVRDFLVAGPRTLSAPVPPVVAAPGPRPAGPPAGAVTAPLPSGEGTRLLAAAPPVAPPPRPRRRGVPWIVLLALVVVAVVAAGLWWYLGSDPKQTGGTAAEHTPSATPSTPKSSDPPQDAVTARGMQDFVEGYLATVTTDPKAAWAMLTPNFQQESGGFGQYKKFWGGIESARVISADAHPATKTISYRVEYTYPDGRTTTDDVTLRLDGVDDDYLIAGES